MSLSRMPLPTITESLPLRPLDWKPNPPVRIQENTIANRKRKRRPQIEGSLKIGKTEFPIVLKLDLIQLLDAIEQMSEEKQ